MRARTRIPQLAMKPPSPTTVVLSDGNSSLAPRYDVTSASGLAAAATLSGVGGGRRTPTATSRGATMAQVSANASFLIVAVTENRAREIGPLRNVEILVVETAKANKINDEISKRFSGSICRVVPVARKYFDQTKGAEDLKRVMSNRVDLNIGKNYVAMAAVSCLMKYIEYIQGVYIAEKTMKVERFAYK
ncbi:hypothetical protein FI667_g14084, partial [Globisporangium splendens]